MLEKHIRIFSSFAITLWVSFLCLTQTACKTTPSQQKGSSATNQAETNTTNQKGNSTANQKGKSDTLTDNNKDTSTTKVSNTATEFDLKLEEDTKTEAPTNNYFYLTVTPKGTGMNLNDLNITAAVKDQEKTVTGKVNKNNRYHSIKKPKSLGALYVEAPSNCLGSEDTNFEKGQAVTFRLMYKPDETAAPGTEYELTVTIKGSGYEKTEPCDFQKKEGKKK